MSHENTTLSPSLPLGEHGQAQIFVRDQNSSRSIPIPDRTGKKRRQRLWRKLLLSSLLLLLIGGATAGGYTYYYGPQPRPHYATTMLERGPIATTVNATGTVNAVVSVQVGTQVSGTIQKLSADFNAMVKEGDV